MVTKDLPADIPINPYSFATPEHQDFSRFPDTILEHDHDFRSGLIKHPRTLGEEVVVEIFNNAFHDLWVIEQCAVHNRFPDFFIPAFNLVIEVDGGYHRKGSLRHRADSYKDLSLSKRGFSIMHLDNDFVVEDFKKTIDVIELFIHQLLPMIYSSGPFSPFGLVEYFKKESKGDLEFTLSNPHDLLSIRDGIHRMYPTARCCPIDWNIKEREKAFINEVNSIDLASLVYDFEPGSNGVFHYKKRTKKISAEQAAPSNP